MKSTSNPFEKGMIKTGNTLTNNMKEEMKTRLEEIITTTNMTPDSRKAWKTIRNLFNERTLSTPPFQFTKLLTNCPSTGESRCLTKARRPVLSHTADESMIYLFSEEEYRRGINTLKNNKATGMMHLLNS